MSVKNKFEIIIFFLFFFGCSNDSNDNSNIFMGYGSDNIGGSGGDTIFVTNLNNSGLGSLRKALEVDSSRIIEFLVNGEIVLKSPIVISSGDLTINGPIHDKVGITLLNYGLQFIENCSNVIIRDLRIKAGKGGTTAAGDCLAFHADSDGSINNILVDHCSLMWASDEIFETYGKVDNLTCQYSIIAEAEDQFNPMGGRNGRGWLSGINSSNISIHHCLFAHNGDRNPYFKGGGPYEFVNNIVYNWSNNNATRITQGAKVDIINNIYIPGNSSSLMAGFIFPEDPELNTHLFVTGNDFAYNKFKPQWHNVTWYSSIDGVSYVHKPAPQSFKAKSRLGHSNIMIDKTRHVYKNVLNNVGARSYDLDDLRIINEVKNRTGEIGKP